MVKEGQKIGQYKILRRLFPSSAVVWVCRCVNCGSLHHINRSYLLTEVCNPCVALDRQMPVKIHPYHQTWQSMIQRCTNPNLPGWINYGGRGISVCDRWRQSFAAFLEDMGRKPSLLHSIDRVNNDGNYEPANCRWATRKQQIHNRRPVSRVKVK